VAVNPPLSPKSGRPIVVSEPPASAGNLLVSQEVKLQAANEEYKG